ncbi:MAG: restriction endonuclease, SacI family [Candidatus Glassbacteria bacterium]
MTNIHIEKSIDLLAVHWQAVLESAKKKQLNDVALENNIVQFIKTCINSSTKSYRYVLPTQLLSKLTNPEIDSRCLQAGRGGTGAFDARTIAHKVIVPFDQENEEVLGGSPEPYVNNPLRVLELSEKFRDAQKNKEDWDYLCSVINEVERRNDRAFTEKIFKQILIEIYRRLSDTKVKYPTPQRISLQDSLHLIEEFIAGVSGGDRVLAIAAAMFEVIGEHFHLYTRIERANITASDSSTGLAADLECKSDNGEIVFVVEVKDRVLTVSQLTSKISNLRERKVTDIFFVAQAGISSADKDEIENIVKKQFASGHNIYITEIIRLSGIIMALVKEEGRIDFLNKVNKQLDTYSELIHRQQWAKLLSTV